MVFLKIVHTQQNAKLGTFVTVFSSKIVYEECSALQNALRAILFNRFIDRVNFKYSICTDNKTGRKAAYSSANLYVNDTYQWKKSC